MTTIPCPDCGIEEGEPHISWCDVAYCLVNRMQRISCPDEHDHGTDVWGGLDDIKAWTAAD